MILSVTRCECTSWLHPRDVCHARPCFVYQIRHWKNFRSPRGAGPDSASAASGCSNTSPRAEAPFTFRVDFSPQFCEFQVRQISKLAQQATCHGPMSAGLEGSPRARSSLAQLLQPRVSTAAAQTSPGSTCWSPLASASSTPKSTSECPVRLGVSTDCSTAF